MGEVIVLFEGEGNMDARNIDKVTYEDIADYFIALSNETGNLITNLKLQKLVYYAQAWHLAILECELFEDDFEAWVHGPVLRPLYNSYKDYRWRPIERDELDQGTIIEIEEKIEKKLGAESVQLIHEVVDEYFGLTAYELERLTHIEDPWLLARNGIPMDQPSNNKIKKEWIKEYYSRLANQ